MTQVDFWLYPLLALSLVSMAMRLSLPFKWAWGFVLQALPILAMAALGLYVEPKWLFASLGWVMVIIFYLPPRLFYNAMQKNLTDLNADQMRVLAGRVKFFFWGIAGQFWQDMALAMASYIDQDSKTAEKYLEKWLENDDLPKQIQKLPLNYKKIGNAVMWNWQWIIDDFERLSEEDRAKQGSSVLLPTARAYAELGDFKSAARCIELSKLGETMVPMNYLALSLLPFFALTGALEKVEKLLTILAKTSGSFAESSKFYWLGRCYRARTEKEKAGEAFSKAKEMAKSNIFQKRLTTQQEKLQEDSNSFDESTNSDSVDKVWAIFKKVAYVQEILSPQRKSLAVNILLVAIVVIFLPTDTTLIQFLNDSGLLKTGLIPIQPLEQIVALRIWVFKTFALYPQQMLHGDYYRLVSYLFLHKHITHMIFNIIGLVWFGRIAENIFGTSRFLAIYMVGGILSGVAHVLLTDNVPAVGASGAVMAVFGAVAIGIFRLKNQIPESIWRFKLSMLGGLALFQIILDQLIPHVAVFAHLGGLLSGVAFGMLLSLRSPNSDQQEITGQFVGG